MKLQLSNETLELLKEQFGVVTPARNSLVEKPNLSPLQLTHLLRNSNVHKYFDIIGDALNPDLTEA